MLSEKKPVDIREGLDELAKQEGMYRVLLPCGEYEGVPIVTLTGWRDKILKRDRARPSEDYLNKIRDGLHDTYRSLTDSKINEYLKAAIDRYPQPSAKSDGTELVESGASAKSITVQEEPPFTVKSMVEYCWGMTLNLSHVPQQNILGKEFNTEFFKRLEKSNSKFSNDFILRLAQTIRTMAFARDAHVRVLNSNAKALSEKKNFWADITQLASFSKEGVPMQVLSFLGAGSFAQVYKFISSNGNTTPVSLPIFLLAGAIGVVAVTIILKIIGTVYMSLQERRIEKNQAIYYRQEFKRQMAISLLNFYRDVKELVKAHYPKYIQGPMYDSDIMSSTDEEVRILISNRILPPDKLNWTVWEETKTD